VKKKLDGLTSEAYSKYASEASEMRRVYEETDTQLSEELATLREQNANLNKRIQAGQLFVKTANGLGIMTPAQVKEINTAMQESKEYKKLMGIPNDE